MILKCLTHLDCIACNTGALFFFLNVMERIVHSMMRKCQGENDSECDQPLTFSMVFHAGATKAKPVNNMTLRWTLFGTEIKLQLPQAMINSKLSCYAITYFHIYSLFHSTSIVRLRSHSHTFIFPSE